jgi:hypothetical protein
VSLHTQHIARRKVRNTEYSSRSHTLNTRYASLSLWLPRWSWVHHNSDSLDTPDLVDSIVDKFLITVRVSSNLTRLVYR